MIDDCYNANPTSVKASIDTLMNFEGRKVAILGDMKELGENELKLHFEVGEYAKQCDLVLAVGPLAKSLAEGAQCDHFDTKEELIAALPKYLKRDDIVLVKASHSMEFEKITEALRALK